MKKVQFTKDFYKKVYDALYECCEKDYEGDISEKYGDMSAEVEVDGYEISCTALVECEIHDESFSHAFGIERDPFAGYYFSDVYGVRDVEVWDSDGDKVDGFSIEDYDAQFIDDEHKGIKKGDMVYYIAYRGYEAKPAEVLFFDNRRSEFCIKTRFNKKFYVSRSRIKKVA